MSVCVCGRSREFVCVGEEKEKERGKVEERKRVDEGEKELEYYSRYRLHQRLGAQSGPAQDVPVHGEGQA